MSYTELIIFSGGLPSASVKYRNAWGGCARIWDALFKAHIPKKNPYDTWLLGDGDRLWQLAQRKDLPEFERAVHAFTFDLFFVRKEHFKRFADDLRSFVQKYPAGGCVDHLPEWAKWLDDNQGQELEAVGLYGTSCANNPWLRYDDSKDKYIPVPLINGTEVYEWIEMMEAQ